MRTVLLLYLLSLLVSCSMITEHRSFVDEMDEQSDPFFVANEDFPVVAGDTGQVYRSKEDIQKRTPASYQQKKARWSKTSLQMELAAREQSLRENSPERYKLYMSYQNQFESVSQKIYYLTLPVNEQREFLYMLGQNHKSASVAKRGHFAERTPASVDTRGLYLGMSKAEVRKSWGEPNSIAIAGQPQFQNERWTYVKEGGVNRIYFESGVVQGWELP